MKNRIELAPGLALDADYFAGCSCALLGKRGAGKTYTARVLVEELVAARVPTVVIDPMGVFWGLRAGADGSKGVAIPVFGGEHGDAPLESSAGALMADLVTQERMSMVLDLSGFTSRTQERTFVAAFLDRLYRTNKDLVHVVVDEADLFAPQKPRGEDVKLLMTMENIVRRGRNVGIGISMATQRAAVLNKDVLTQVDVLVAMRVAAPQDRDAIREWVRGQGDEATWQKVAPSLPGLANGECWVWVPEKNILKQIQVRATTTFDSSATRKRGSAVKAPKALAEVDLAAISERIAASIERAKATDPKELTHRIRELEKKLAAKTAPLPPQIMEVVEVPVIDDADIARLEAAAHGLLQLRDAASGFATEIYAALAKMTEAIMATQIQKDGQGTSPPKSVKIPKQPKSAERKPAKPALSPSRAASDGVTPARLRLLDALASLEGIGVNVPNKTQLALFAGVSPKSGGYANNLGALRSGGLIDYPVSGHVQLTGEGRSLAVVDVPIASTDDLHEKIRALVSPARWRILNALIEVYPDSIPKTELAAAAGVPATSGGYANNLGALRSLGLLDYPAAGQVIATDTLFLNPVAGGSPSRKG